MLGRILGAGGSAAAPITPEQAAQVSPADVGAIAAHAEQHDATIVDQIGAFYAQQPTLAKTLGAAALTMVLSYMSSQQ